MNSLEASVSIIICTNNRADHLRQTLASLAEVRVPEGLSCELLVADNGSTDETARIVQSCSFPNMPVRCVFEPRRGKSYGLNTALATAQGNIFLFTDDDVRFPAAWLEGMCAPILMEKGDIVVGGVRLALSLERHWMRPIHRDWLASTVHVRPGAPTARVGANMAFSRRVLSQVPSFDTELGPGASGFGEETLFFDQAERAGYKVCLAGPESVVTHHCGADRLSRASFLATAEKHGRSGAYVAHHWAHGVFPRPRLCLARAVLRLTAWRLIRRGQWPETEGCPEWEMQLARDVSFFRQYLRERTRTRCYEKYGLVKTMPTSRSYQIPPSAPLPAPQA